MSDLWPYRTPGIPDELFIRAENIPMTREEIRVLSVAKARLQPGQVVWDIGSGTGSISVEAARQVSGGWVYAVDKSREAVTLTCQNALRFGISNIKVIEGEAPEVLNSLPVPDRVFIGGSGGQLPEIILLSYKRLKDGGRLVINAVTMETVVKAITCMRELSLLLDVIQVNITRAVPVGDIHLLKALNPVFIIVVQK